MAPATGRNPEAALPATFRLFRCFEFTDTGVVVHQRPTFDEAESALGFTLRAVKGSGFWIVDLIHYIESREDWGDRREALISAHTGLTDGTISVYRSLGKSLPPENRVEGVDFGHHHVVASLEPEEQVEWLEKSKAEGWTQTELRQEVRAAKRVNLNSGSARDVQQLEVVLHVSVEAPSYTKAATLASAEVKRLIKNLPGGLILDAEVAIVKARK